MHSKAIEAIEKAMRSTDPDGCEDPWSYVPWATDIVAHLEAEGLTILPLSARPNVKG